MPRIIKFDSMYPKYQGKKQADQVWRRIITPRLFKKVGKKLVPTKKRVAILYSANNTQAQRLYDAYDDGTSTKISGGGQAVLFGNLEQKIQKKGLQERVRILPVPTSLTGGNNSVGNHVGLTIMRISLENIAYHLGMGFEVLAIKDTDKTSPHEGEFAIGGSISANWFTTKSVWLTQDSSGTLTLQTSKSRSKAPQAERISQGDYMQDQLELLAKAPRKDWPQYLQDAYQLGKQGKPAPWLGKSSKIKSRLTESENYGDESDLTEESTSESESTQETAYKFVPYAQTKEGKIFAAAAARTRAQMPHEERPAGLEDDDRWYHDKQNELMEKYKKEVEREMNEAAAKEPSKPLTRSKPKAESKSKSPEDPAFKESKKEIKKLQKKLEAELKKMNMKLFSLFVPEKSIRIKRAKINALKHLSRAANSKDLINRANRYKNDKDVMDDTLSSRTKKLINRISSKTDYNTKKIKR